MVQMLKWLVSVGLFLLLGYVGIYSGLTPGSAKDIEQKLATIANTSVNNAGHGSWATVTLDGQSATITGEAPDLSARNAAIVAVRTATGDEGPLRGGITVVSGEDISIKVVEEETTNTLQVESPYRFRADYQDGFMRISESVPDEESRQRLTRYIEEIFSVGTFFDNTRLALGAPDENWVPMLQVALLSLSALDKGKFVVEDRHITIDGSAKDDETAILAIDRAKSMPPGYSVSIDIDVGGQKTRLDIAAKPLPVPPSSTQQPVSELPAGPAALPNYPQIENNDDQPSDEVTPNGQNTDDQKENVNASIPTELTVPQPTQKLPKEETKGLPPAPEPIINETGELREPPPAPDLESSTLSPQNTQPVNSTSSLINPTLAIIPLVYQDAPSTVESSFQIQYRQCKNEIALHLKENPILFNPDSTDIRQETRPVLAGLADIAKRCEQFQFHIFGYTDNNDTIDNAPDLGQKRAEKISAYLVSRGAPKKTLTIVETESISDGQRNQPHIDIALTEIRSN